MRVGNVVKAALFCMAALTIYLYLYRVLSWKDTGGDYLSTMETFYGLDDDVVDVLFLGNSHSYCSVNSAILWERYGMAAYSLSISGQDLAGSYYCMKEALKTQKPKVVCLEVFGCLMFGYDIKGNLYRNLLGYRPSLNFRDAVNSLAEEEERQDILWKWPIVHTRYAEITEKDFKPDKKSRTYMGYEAGYDITDIGALPVYPVEESVAIDGEAEEWLRKIMQLADESEISLCFFLAPYTMTETGQKQFRYVQEMAEENNIPFLDMIALQNELGLDVGRDFMDAGHTNSYGAEKITKYLGQYLSDYYVLDDRRGDARYALWDENLQVWKHEEQNNNIRQTQELGAYLGKISQLEDYIAIVVTRGNYLADDEGVGLTDKLADMGIGERFFAGEGVWVVADGVAQYEALRAGGQRHMEIGGSDLLAYESDGQMSIVIDRQEYKKASQGIDIILYDNVLGRIVDVVGFQAGEDYRCYR